MKHKQPFLFVAIGALSSLVMAASLGACGASRGGSGAGGSTTAVAAPSGELRSSSGVSCQNDNECAVCYRAETCGEAIAASDPRAETPECHVSPSAFCMPRRAHCDEGHCVAR